MSSETSKLLPSYLREIEQQLGVGQATEGAHRPALKALLEGLEPGIVASNEPRRVECGAPDFVVSREGLVVGYLETKAVEVSLEEAERSEQLKRYRHSLDNLVLTNYLEFRWYVDGERRSTARLGQVDAEGRLKRRRGGSNEVLRLLQDFLAHAPEPIATPRELAERMARLTHIIRDIIVETFEKDKASPLLRDLRQAFAQTLIPDLDEPEKVGEFADMYAQTIAYGLFAARCNHGGPGPFRRLGAAREIPNTNPFLRKLFETMTGTELDGEPYAPFVDDLVQLLDNADVAAILSEFGRRNRREDPVVHFYETFLATYDPALREMRGVYYTPEPVVSYIVRSVDHLLRTRFGLSNGLADTATVEYEREEDSAEPRKVKDTAPRVLILDPACGTGTFLYAVVDHIRESFMAQNNAGMWCGYVRRHLLPRLFGFELLMAPYAVAHLKLGMQLAGQDLTEAQREVWAYDFSGDERLGIYLTNTLEEAEREIETLFGPLRVITEEANAAAHVKRDLPIMVVLGNPPYSGHSANRSWEVKDGKRVRTFIGDLLRDYYHVDGHPLAERNPKWLQDDYVKFIRWAQWRIERTGAGILAFISNNGYLDNPTFRGMRQALMNAFTDIYVLDLHGSTRKREVAPDGSPDENVFDIQQGVTIGIFVKEPDKDGPAQVYHADLWGLRGHKYGRLLEENVATTPWEQLQPQSPFYLFTPQDIDLLGEYQTGWKVTDIFYTFSMGITTARDHFVTDFDEETLRNRFATFRGMTLSDDEVRERFGLRDTRAWSLSQARVTLRADRDWGRAFAQCLYRAFDVRPILYHDAIIERSRLEVMHHILAGTNVSLICIRRTREGSLSNFYVSNRIVDKVCISSVDNAHVFPLYLYPSDEQSTGQQRRLFEASPWPPGKDGRRPNLAPEFVADLEKQLGMQFVPDGSGDLQVTFGPEDAFHYIYAVLHSPTYRDRYAEFLKIDFPRVPLTSDPDLFRELCALGKQLVALHLLEAPQVSKFITRYPVPGDSRVERGYPKYLAAGEPEPGTGKPLQEGRVYVNKKQYFEGVPEEVWEFHVGGYQVCEKWLRDRRGRQLTFDDLAHYQKVVVALHETIRLMAETDGIIEEWPIK